MKKITREDREQLLQQKAKVIWFTGLSGSGKSTLAIGLESCLNEMGYKTYLLDGDDVRLGLNKDLTFTNDDRKENIRRVGEVSKLFLDAGLIVLCAFVSPFNDDRFEVSKTVGQKNYLEIFVDCPISICEQRDVKGHYKKARSGGIKNFTGIDSPYERPNNPDLVIPTDDLGIDESIIRLKDFFLSKI